ncbi:hypothetical protein SSLG_02336 [Streptomyces sp. SPB78]|nr:hypothetical protein SSLG_02336 [Streptomyces sp. SPB78]
MVYARAGQDFLHGDDRVADLGDEVGGGGGVADFPQRLDDGERSGPCLSDGTAGPPLQHPAPPVLLPPHVRRPDLAARTGPLHREPYALPAQRVHHPLRVEPCHGRPAGRGGGHVPHYRERSLLREPAIPVPPTALTHRASGLPPLPHPARDSRHVTPASARPTPRRARGADRPQRPPPAHPINAPRPPPPGPTSRPVQGPG